MTLQCVEKASFSLAPTPAAMSPARPEAAKAASLPRDAPFREQSCGERRGSARVGIL